MHINAFGASARRNHSYSWFKTAASIGLMSLIFVPPAHADLFGGASKTPQPAKSATEAQAVTSRFERLEQELRELREKTTQLQNGPMLTPPTPPSGVLDVPSPAAPVVDDYDLTYVKLGEVDGKVFVRQGQRRLVMTTAQYESFKEKESLKALQKAEVSKAGPLPAPGPAPRMPGADSSVAAAPVAPSAGPAPLPGGAQPTTPMSNVPQGPSAPGGVAK